MFHHWFQPWFQPLGYQPYFIDCISGRFFSYSFYYKRGTDVVASIQSEYRIHVVFCLIANHPGQDSAFRNIL